MHSSFDNLIVYYLKSKSKVDNARAATHYSPNKLSGMTSLQPVAKFVSYDDIGYPANIKT